MGQFSWFTQDTHHRIVNDEPHKVCMTDDKGNQYWEECYEGYGVFGGKDYFELMAEMNGFSGDKDILRIKGIELAFDGSPTGESTKWKHPSLTENGRYYGGVAPTPDPDQGFTLFDEDEEDWNEDEW